MGEYIYCYFCDISQCWSITCFFFIFNLNSLFATLEILLQIIALESRGNVLMCHIFVHFIHIHVVCERAHILFFFFYFLFLVNFACCRCFCILLFLSYSYALAFSLSVCRFCWMCFIPWNGVFVCRTVYVCRH